MTYSAIVIGDSFNNTLGLIRSLGEGGIEQTLILVGESDRMCVGKSKYLKKALRLLKNVCRYCYN